MVKGFLNTCTNSRSEVSYEGDVFKKIVKVHEKRPPMTLETFPEKVSKKFAFNNLRWLFFLNITLS